VHNIQSAGISRHSRDIAVPNIQLVGIFQCKILSQQGYSGTEYSADRDIPVIKYSAGRDIPVQNIQAAGVFQ
jgi:hypothetical protein